MSKAKTKEPKRDVHNRKAKAFRAMGKEFKYEFIPSAHFQEILHALLTASMTMGSITELTLFEIATSMIKGKIYDILADVLEYQNEHEFISAERLAKITSPMEIAKFSSLIMEDEEIVEAFQEYISSLGKLENLLPKVEEKAAS